jgi:hypothetical protein
MLHSDFLGQIQSNLGKGVPDSYSGYTTRLLSTRSPCNLSPSSDLEKDLDCLLKIREGGATAYREAPRL